MIITYSDLKGVQTLVLLIISTFLRLKQRYVRLYRTLLKCQRALASLFFFFFFLQNVLHQVTVFPVLSCGDIKKSPMLRVYLPVIYVPTQSRAVRKKRH